MKIQGKIIFLIASFLGFLSLFGLSFAQTKKNPVSQQIPKQYDVSAFIWPSYHPDDRAKIFWPMGIGEWETVMKNKPKFEGHEQPRYPLWGYINEADPYVMEMEINAAADHGVNVFIFDWYWYDGMPFLEGCLNEGYLKARNNDRVKFYIMWANHDVDMTWDKRNAGLPNDALNWFREETKKAGFKGLDLQLSMRKNKGFNVTGVAGDNLGTQKEIVEKLNFNGLTHYQFCHFINVDRDYLDIMKDVVLEWDAIDNDYNIPYYPHVSIGWDNNPRFEMVRKGIVKNNTPENFEKALLIAKEYVDAHPAQAPLIIINSWNEWTETSYLQPCTMYGYGYLEAVKRVFGEKSQ